jgi:hypothetical protein
MTINDLLEDFVKDLPIGITKIKKEFVSKEFDIELDKSHFSFSADTGTVDVTNYILNNVKIFNVLHYHVDHTCTKEFSFEGYIYMQKVLKAYFENILKGFEQK